MKFCLLATLILFTTTPTISVSWPTKNTLYLSCFHNNIEGIKRYQSHTIREIRAYCKCRAKHIKNYHKFNKTKPPKPVMEFFIKKINKMCLPTKSM